MPYGTNLASGQMRGILYSPFPRLLLTHFVFLELRQLFPGDLLPGDPLELPGARPGLAGTHPVEQPGGRQGEACRGRKAKGEGKQKEKEMDELIHYCLVISFPDHYVHLFFRGD